MKHIHTFESFVNENLNEAKKEKFLLYTNPNNSTNRAYVAIGSAKVKDVMNSAKKYSGSYQILHQGSGTNDDLQKAISMYSNYNFGDVQIDESFLNEGKTREFEIEIHNKNGTKTTQKIMADPGTTELFRIIAGIKKSPNVKDVHIKETNLSEAASVPSNVMDFAKRKGSYATSLVKKAATWAEKAGKRISGGTAIGKNYSTIILDMDHQGSEIYINLDNETIELHGEEVTDAKSFQKVLDANMNESLDEAISSDASKAAAFINSEYEKDGFDHEAFGYALKGFFKKQYPSEDIQSEILDILGSKYRFNFEPNKAALLISSRMY